MKYYESLLAVALLLAFNNMKKHRIFVWRSECRVEGTAILNKDIDLSIIAVNDTIRGRYNEGVFCFDDWKGTEGPIDIRVAFGSTELIYHSLYPGFLKLSYRPIWVLTIDRKPFDRRAYPRIKELEEYRHD